MPKQKITKEMVVNAAFALARDGGMEQVLVKNIAGNLGCSVQPVYSYLKNMKELRREVEKKAAEFVREYVLAHMDKEDLFGSTGRAYVGLAKEEPHIFRIFIMYQREGISSLEELYSMEANPEMVGEIADKLHISAAGARQLHLNMLIYTMGLCTILATASPGIPKEEIYRQQKLAYEAFLSQAEKRREESE